jgi:hypothetical protein
MKSLYTIRVERSQTDHVFVAVYAADSWIARDKVALHYPGAFYYSVAAKADIVLE